MDGLWDIHRKNQLLCGRAKTLGARRIRRAERNRREIRRRQAPIQLRPNHRVSPRDQRDQPSPDFLMMNLVKILRDLFSLFGRGLFANPFMEMGVVFE